MNSTDYYSINLNKIDDETRKILINIGMFDSDWDEDTVWITEDSIYEFNIPYEAIRAK